LLNGKDYVRGRVDRKESARQMESIREDRVKGRRRGEGELLWMWSQNNNSRGRFLFSI
jgi:hypothetical protein